MKIRMTITCGCTSKRELSSAFVFIFRFVLFFLLIEFSRQMLGYCTVPQKARDLPIFLIKLCGTESSSVRE